MVSQRMMTYGFSKLMTHGFSKFLTRGFSKLMTHGLAKLTSDAYAIHLKRAQGHSEEQTCLSTLAVKSLGFTAKHPLMLFSSPGIRQREHRADTVIIGYIVLLCPLLRKQSVDVCNNLRCILSGPLFVIEYTFVRIFVVNISLTFQYTTQHNTSK